jgi:hypothetical protein
MGAVMVARREGFEFDGHIAGQVGHLSLHAMVSRSTCRGIWPSVRASSLAAR